MLFIPGIKLAKPPFCMKVVYSFLYWKKYVSNPSTHNWIIDKTKIQQSTHIASQNAYNEDNMDNSHTRRRIDQPSPQLNILNELHSRRDVMISVDIDKENLIYVCVIECFFSQSKLF